MPETFRPADRIRRRAEFEHVYDTGTRAHGRLMSLYCAPSQLGRPRLGITASRKIGGAVVRNTAKRRIREVFRKTKHDLPSLDIIVVPRVPLLASPLPDVEAEYRSLLRRTRRRERS
ncbi:MAG: ribonuclease P protein component [Vicinamibacterales bacterium]